MLVKLTWTYAPLGEAALLIGVEPANLVTNQAVQRLARALAQQQLAGVIALVPAVNSLLIQFDLRQTSHTELERQARAVCESFETTPPAPSREISIPVRYGGEHGPDLAEVAERLGMTPAEVVAEHCAHRYPVLMIGFAPGYPYLGGLPERLTLPRRDTPRAAVPAGSVAIAAGMTGIYPARLPGGWHLIGRTDVTLFDALADPPSLLEPGDHVRFVAIDAESR
jgi:KipI family sensor histidine kinase inhibitor